MRERVLSPVGERTIWDELTHMAARQPDALFVREPGAVDLTYGAMVERALAAAEGLRTVGVRPGDRVHIHLPNGTAFLVVWLGTVALGAVAVPTNPESSPDELAYILSHAGCVVSITTSEGRASVEETRDLCPELREVLEPADLELGAGVFRHRGSETKTTDAASLLYTSGTTSWPKGVIVTHANFLVAGSAVAAHLRLRPEDRWLVTLPLFHGNALFYSTMSALVTGASLVVVDGLDPDRWVDQLRENDTTVTSFFAVGVRRLLATSERSGDGDHRMRAAVFAQHLTARQIAAFEGRFGFRLVQIYGMTETVAPVVTNPLYGDRRNATIGLPALGYDVRVVADDGGVAPQGEPGELQVRGVPGVTVMAGYHAAPELTARTLRDGWLRTGDHVLVDEDGYLTFLDRGTDLLKPRVENISTGEIERVLREHPSVLEAAVVGVENDDHEEVVKAFVVVRSGDDVTREELIEFCGGRLAPFKVPGVVEFLDDLPRTPVGKVQKHLLREI